ncbi:glycosyltransferase [Aeromonas media]|uniref:Glycosyltransferase n=1 Tax=Aeromonas media TaxID=651 RepID=A0AAE7AFA1_AERME|nr:glycosyltransferase [Aeromonas media]QJT30052.1 glycosyltransferase [Aeromonas media]
MHKWLIKFTSIGRVIRQAVRFYQGSPILAVKRVFRIWRREGILGVQRRANILVGGLMASPLNKDGDNIYVIEPAESTKFNPKVSVIVPNYNHAPYLQQRLESIYRQTYENIEVILLDDCSSDNSIEILTDFSSRFPNRTICNFNDVNSGSVFRQWKKGLDIASGELVWIAESDDFCSDDFLAEQVKAFNNSAVMLSFCNVEFVSGESCEPVWSLASYLSELAMHDWSKPFIRSAHSLVSSGWGIKNLVPNVSGAVFRKPHNFSLLDDERWQSLRMCGDWVFYLSLIRGGLVSYTPVATNYYRQHSASTSQTAQKQDVYYLEHEIVASYLVQYFKVDKSLLSKQYDVLYSHWCSLRGSNLQPQFHKLYDFERLWQLTCERKPNIVMAVYALVSGGGETFPIILANQLKKNGYAVTVFNCKERVTEPGVLNMLEPGIPVLELSNMTMVRAAFEDMGIEIIHSHHAWVDLTLASLLSGNQDIKHVISMHGMYEMMSSAQREAVTPLLMSRINHFVYTAEKNIQGLPESIQSAKSLTRINNALPVTKVEPVDLSSLQIYKDDFVVCMVARAIPEKGWKEAIHAVNLANMCSVRKIHLLLIGDGPEHDRLCQSMSSDTIHFLGFRQNIRDYFSSSHLGLLPSKFKGESAPLVVIDCLLVGKPILASNIGEIANMISSPEGIAGQLLELDKWELNPKEMGECIAALANQSDKYQEICSHVASASSKYSIDSMTNSYEMVYRSCLTNS